MFYAGADGKCGLFLSTYLLFLTVIPFVCIFYNMPKRKCAGKEALMATESFGQTVHLTDEMADRIIEGIERVRINPPEPPIQNFKWGDPAKLAMDLKKQYDHEE
jgi:hypothetical protein